MSVALYRKYRPKTFSEVTNQNHVKITLQNEITANKLAHAYLFCGPRGTGKTTLARLLSKAVNCLDLQENAEPCNKCQHCMEILQNKSLDIIEIDAASHTGVENVRENIINNARFSPTNSKYKVFIIDEVHMLSTPAFNALLKTLEEPPKHIIFILATTEAHKVPVTIISRCQRFDFKKIITNELVDRLRWIVGQEKIQVEEKVLEIIAKNAGGCVRDAESLLEQILSLDNEKITYEQAQLVLPKSDYENLYNLFEKIIKKDTRQAISVVNSLVDDGVDIVQYTSHLIDFLRRIMLYLVNGQRIELSNEIEEELVDKIVALVKDLPANRLVEMIEIFLEKKAAFRQSNIIQLPLEIAILQSIEGSATPRTVHESLPQKSLPNEPQPVQVIVETPAVADIETKIEIDKPVNNFIQNNDEVIIKKNEPFENNNEEEIVCVGNEVVEEKIATQSESIETVKTNGGLTLTFNQVVSRWPVIVQQIRTKDYTLSMSMCVAKPLGLQGNVLQLGFPFELQKSKVDTPQNLGIIEVLLEAEFGTKIKIATCLDSKIQLDESSFDDSGTEVKVEQTETKDPISKVLDSFGGSIVNKI